MPTKASRKLDVDPDVVKARGALGVALRDFNEEAAARAAIALVRARRADKRRRAQAIIEATEAAHADEAVTS